MATTILATIPTLKQILFSKYFVTFGSQIIIIGLQLIFWRNIFHSAKILILQHE